MIIHQEYPLRLHGGNGREVITSSSYFFDNATRAKQEAQHVLQFTLSGSGVFECAGMTHKLKSGDAFLFTMPEASRYYYPIQHREPWVISWFSFAGGSGWWQDLRRRFGSVIALEKNGEAAAMVTDLGQRFLLTKFYDGLQASEYLYRTITTIERELISQLNRNPIERAREYIESRFDQPVTVKEIAAHYQLSREHFIRLFTAAHGCSPGQLLRQLRLRRARSLVLETSMSLFDIASHCGYADASSFSRAFCREFGRSAEELRKSRRSKNRSASLRRNRSPV